MDRGSFDIYVETQLAPTLLHGAVMILGNLSTRKSPGSAEILKAHGRSFLFLPAHSSGLNPIKLAFSKLKVHLRRPDAATGRVIILYNPPGHKSPRAAQILTQTGVWFLALRHTAPT